MNDVATYTFLTIKKLENATIDEVDGIKSDFRKAIKTLSKEQRANIISFLKAAIICGDLKILKLYHETFPSVFKKIASPYLGTKNKRLAKFLAETIG